MVFVSNSSKNIFDFGLIYFCFQHQIQLQYTICNSETVFVSCGNSPASDNKMCRQKTKSTKDQIRKQETVPSCGICFRSEESTGNGRDVMGGGNGRVRVGSNGWWVMYGI